MRTRQFFIHALFTTVVAFVFCLGLAACSSGPAETTSSESASSDSTSASEETPSSDETEDSVEDETLAEAEASPEAETAVYMPATETIYGTSTNVEAYEYDDQGRPARTTISSDGVTTFDQTFTWPDDLTMESTADFTSVDGYRGTYRISFAFTVEGDRILSYVTNTAVEWEDGYLGNSFTETFTYSYDAEGRVTGYDAVTSDGIRAGESMTAEEMAAMSRHATFDANGYCTSIAIPQLVGMEGAIDTTTIEYDFDDANHPTGFTATCGDRTASFTCTTDEAGNILTISDESGKLLAEYTYEKIENPGYYAKIHSVADFDPASVIAVVFD